MVNIAVLIGRLTADPELKTTSSGVSVCRFSIAVSRNFHRDGEKPETDFINVLVWRNVAEFVCKYFSKGQMISVQGRIQTRKFKDKNGEEKTSIEISAENVDFAGPKPGTTASHNTPKEEIPKEEPQEQKGFEEITGSDDDLPF